MWIYTCLGGRVVKGGRGFDGHGGDGAVADLSAGIATSARLRQFLRLGRLAAEVAAAHHLLGRRLAPEAASDQDLLGRRRLSPKDIFGRAGQCDVISPSTLNGRNI